MQEGPEMNHSRFDTLVRLLAEAHSRRTLVGLAGGVLAGTVAGEAAGGTKRKRRKQQRVRAQDHEGEHCAKVGQKAEPKKHCCPGLVGDANGRCEPEPPPPPSPPPPPPPPPPPDACDIARSYDPATQQPSLRGLDLAGCNLAFTSLVGADLTGANLRGAIL